ncbi:MAG: SusD/RagB family nutrient-binding outer membrane lipoprotein [Flavobacteriaceae bacterium]
MRRIFLKISIAFTFISLVFTSCETTDLDLLENPNEINTEKANIDRFLNQIQIDFASFMYQIGDNASELTRIDYMFGRTYENNYQPAVLNGLWATAYSGHLADIAAALPLAEEVGLNKHAGIMKVLKGYTYITLVDNFGDVPFSQANQATDFPQPVADSGSSVYEGAIQLINEGISLLVTDGPELEYDFYYNNDASKWIKLANSVKMQAYLALGDYSSFNAIASDTDSFINNSANDFQFQYGTTVIPDQLDTRHPTYQGDYTGTGVGSYRANWIMDEMLNSNDPRRFFYFFRQVSCTPGATCDPDGDQEFLTCSVTAAPNHYPAGMVFCSVEDGYWGRDHGNAEGIPPDRFKRTASGVYPAGGKYDKGSFGSVIPGSGGGGAGIMPIMLSSFTKFMRAEVAMAAQNYSQASSLLENALNDSTNKVVNFGTVDATADPNDFPTASEIQNFISSTITSFNGANPEGKWEILAKQNFITHYGNGLNPYNFYRRTGYPKTLQFNIEPNSGGFVRSFLYPANEANVNSNITQKPNVLVQVFWDTKPASPGFPSAN